MRKLFIISAAFFCMTIGSVVFGQTSDCYDDLLRKGKDQYDTGNYSKALIKWKGALDCPDLTSAQIQTLNKWIEKAQISPSIDGIVVDAKDGSPIPGANIIFKGTTTGTVADMNGKFSLNRVKAEGVIVVSFVGYCPEEFKVVSNKNTYKVSLNAKKWLQECN